MIRQKPPPPYAIVLTYEDAPDRVWSDGMNASEIPETVENLDYTDNWTGAYVTRNGQRLRGPVRLSGPGKQHKAIQNSHAELGFLRGLSPPLRTVSGKERRSRIGRGS